MRKNKRIILLVLVIIICGIAVYSAKGLSLFDTDVQDSLKTFTQINLQNDFTNASKVGLGNPATIETWKDNYNKITKKYFEVEFRNTLSDEKADQLLNAELTMNKKRKIQISDVKINGDTATATVSISKVNYSDIVSAAVKNIEARKTSEDLSSPDKLSDALADELIKGYENASPSSDMTSFSITCKKVLINNTNKDLNKDPDWMTKYVLPRIAGHCWYPQNFDDFFEKLNKAVES